MANSQIDPFMHAFMWKALPIIFLASIAALLLREGLRWLERKAKGAGRSRQSKREVRSFGTRETKRTGDSRRSQTAATGSRTPAQRHKPLQEPQPLALGLKDLTWENFELLAGEIFRRKGFEVHISSGLGADGGKDLTLRRDGEIRLVQCKCFSAENKVSVASMREFYGLIVAEKAKRGIFMTTGLYSREAQEFAEGKPIKLLGRAEIEQLMASVARPGENLCDIGSWINDFAAGARVTNPDCPRCRQPMKLRRGVTGGMFWGCSSFPRCRGKRDARTELVQAFSYQGS
jgi:hypothetical protein